MEPPDAVQPDSPAAGAASARSAHIDCRASAPPQSPKLRRTHVAEHRAGTAGEHGLHRAPVADPQRMTDRVHTSMNSMKAPARHPMRHCASTDTELAQLPDGHTAMLPPGQLGDRPITWAIHYMYVVR